MMLTCAICVSLVGALAAGNLKTQEPAKSVILLTMPKLDWALEVGGTELIVEKKEIAADGKSARFMAADWTSGILISGFLEDRGRPATPEQCRDFYFARLKDTPPLEEDIAQSKLGDMAVVEYIVKEFGGRKIDHKHMNAYLTKGNFWMDVHLSKMNFKEGQRDAFNAILRNVKLVPKAPASIVRANYRIPQQAILKLDLPPSWGDEVQQRSGLARMVLKFDPVPAGSAFMFISVLCPKEELSDTETKRRIRVLLEDGGRKLLPQSVEPSIELREFKGRSSAGYCFTLTDKAPKPGEYKYMTQGGYAAGKLILMFELMFNDKDSGVSNLALEMVGGSQAMPDK